jgi:hypothetical protein
MGHGALGIVILLLPLCPSAPVPLCPSAPPLPTPHSPQIYISPRIMINKGQKPDRFSYQRVKTGEDESPGYWR